MNTRFPISGVVVTIGSISTTTIADGKFVLENVPEGNYTLEATKTDYEHYMKTITIVGDQNQSQEILMTPSILGTTLSGTVTNSETGSAVQNVKVVLAGQTDYTDATGHYQIANVPQGTLELTAEIEGYLNFKASVFISSSDKVFNIDLIKGTEITSSNFDRNKLFTYKNSPYFIRNSIEMAQTDTLIIEPGVVVRFDDGTKISQRTQELFDKSVIIAIGTGDRPIKFTSNKSVPSVGDWLGLSFYTTNATNKLEYIVVEYATIAISVIGEKRLGLGKAIIQNNEIGISGSVNFTDGIIRKNEYGAKHGQLTGISFSNVLFVDNSATGMYTSNSTTTNKMGIDYCTFKNNGYGVYISRGKTYEYVPINVSNSVFENNTGYGMKISGDITNIKNNNFINNGGFAFDRYAYWFPESNDNVDNNYIAGNNGLSSIMVDLTINGTGGQYETNRSTAYTYGISNPRSIPNMNIGCTWNGF